ncbi:MAG: 50S ribosomal protein L30 [Calditrichaeota bacterium]|nr:50S ribosomal protein L30 [Calditrichota bacterium]
MSKELKITQIRSAIGRPEHQKRVIRALGFRRLHQSRVVADTPSLRGMLDQVVHLVRIEELHSAPAPKKRGRSTKSQESSTNA